MRHIFALVPLALLASPALAQSAYPPPPPPPELALPPQLAGAMALDRVSNAAEAISRALLKVPVGEVRAAVQGREPTARDKHESLGADAGLTDRDVHAQIEAAKPMIANGAKAMARALPVIMRSLADVRGSLDRAMANLPDPNYPRQ